MSSRWGQPLQKSSSNGAAAAATVILLTLSVTLDGVGAAAVLGGRNCVHKNTKGKEPDKILRIALYGGN